MPIKRVFTDCRAAGPQWGCSVGWRRSRQRRPQRRRPSRRSWTSRRCWFSRDLNWWRHLLTCSSEKKQAQTDAPVVRPPAAQLCALAWSALRPVSARTSGEQDHADRRRRHRAARQYPPKGACYWTETRPLGHDREGNHAYLEFDVAADHFWAKADKVHTRTNSADSNSYPTGDTPRGDRRIT